MQIVDFNKKLLFLEVPQIKPLSLTTMQVNIGYLCNQTCLHCHVNAGPERKEQMDSATVDYVLKALKEGSFTNLDITGGAPEMNENFKYLVIEAKKLGLHIMVRTNLTIILEQGYEYLPQFFKDNNVELFASMPHYLKKTVDKQRGYGVFDTSLKALKLLNDAGYGKDKGLILNFVYNPTGAFFAPPQETLEEEFKREFMDRYKVSFNSLYTITNFPVGKFKASLKKKNTLDNYMEKLSSSFNEATLENVMCRHMISVAYDGFIYDCDFNQMEKMKTDVKNNHIKDFKGDDFLNRTIKTDNHCYGCTAGRGASCTGEVA